MIVTEFRPPTPREVQRLERPLVAAKVFVDSAEMQHMLAAEPWHVLVNDRGDVAVLSRWRDHLPVLSVDALWCPITRVTSAVRSFRELARAHDLTDVVSPPTPIEEIGPFEAAGMHVHTVVTTYVTHRLTGLAVPRLPAGVVVRAASHSDLAALLRVDAESFEPFWRYDARHIARFFATGRFTLAEAEGRPVGYTLCTVDGEDGLLGRLCVSPEWRRRGIGSALLIEAMRYVGRHGGDRLTLSTQIDNVPSQALYRRTTLRDTGRRYAFLRFGADEG